MRYTSRDAGRPALLRAFLFALLFAMGGPVSFPATALAQNESGQPQKIKVLIVTGFDAGAHKWHDTTEQARLILAASGLFDVRVCEDKGIFESSVLEDYDVVVLNYGFWSEPEPSPSGKERLLDYVRDGHGLVSLHFACSSFQNWEAYADLLGRTWKRGTGGHGPRGPFTVNIKNQDHPITRGLSDFEIDDELYAKLSGDAEIEVLASAYSQWSDKVEPIVFVKRYGKGRVVHNVLGHDTRARDNESYQKLLIRGVQWAANREATGS